MRSFIGRDILSLKDFERAEFFRVFEVCDRLRPHAEDRRNTDLLKDKTLLTAFYQPSTRTRLATEAAMHRLGGHVLGFSDPRMTRAGDFYQESIKDTVHIKFFAHKFEGCLKAYIRQCRQMQPAGTIIHFVFSIPTGIFVL